MFAKVFYQIFESSISEDYITRHVFMDMLVLADEEGVVDKTPEAISRITNVPLEIVKHAIEILCLPDENSRTHDEDGRRLTLIDEHRNWGWRIVNFLKYRGIRDEEARRIANRSYKREQRAKQKAQVSIGQQTSAPVLDSQQMSAHIEAEAEEETTTPRGKRVGDPRFKPFKEVLAKAWKAKNTLEMPWGAGAAKQLSMLLSNNPTLTEPDLTTMLRNRHRSQINHSAHPVSWISRITDYASGPLNEYGKPLELSEKTIPFKPVTAQEKLERQMAQG